MALFRSRLLRLGLVELLSDVNLPLLLFITIMLILLDHGVFNDLVPLDLVLGLSHLWLLDLVGVFKLLLLVVEHDESCGII